MSWLTYIFGEPDDWRLVKIHVTDYYSQLKPAHPDYDFTDSDANKTDHEYSYYLYENQHGGRKIDVIDSLRGDLEMKTEDKRSFVFRNTEYRNIIRPWLDGRLDPEIPSYEQAPVNDFHAKLKGKR